MSEANTKSHTIKLGDTLTARAVIEHDGRVTEVDIKILLEETTKSHAVLDITLGDIASQS